jgi:hypothetical protein
MIKDQYNWLTFLGIIIAENLPRWMDLHGRLRLSQVLDMYYSDRGVSFDNEIKACRRNDLAKQFVPMAKLKEQVIGSDLACHLIFLKSCTLRQ